MSLHLLADIILALHVLWVAYIVLAVPLILIGAGRGWGWIRNSWFRNTHLAMMGLVVVETLFAITCPLTEWEYALRQQHAPSSFVGHWLERLLYYDLAPWVFVVGYLAFFLLIGILYFKVPPRCFNRSHHPPTPN